MTDFTIRRWLALLLAMVLLSGSFLPVLAEEGAPPEETAAQPTEPAETVPPPEEPATEPPTEPVPEPPVPSEPPAEPTEEPPEPSETPDMPSEPVEETTVPTEPSEEPLPPADSQPTEPPQAEEEGTEPTIPHILPILDDMEEDGPQIYFGQLHSHSSPVSGSATIRDLFSRAAQTAGLDFFAITDHSDSFDNAASGSIEDGSVSQYWAAGKAAARAVTGTNFVGIYGFEMSWPENMYLGHIGTFNTPGFQSWKQEPYSRQADALEAYYETLSSAAGAIGQWNHPGGQYGTFSDFAHYSREADQVIQLLEVDGESTASGYQDGYWYYNRALDKGWHVAPSNNGESARTAVLAEALTEGDIYSAIRAHRVYATDDADLEVYYALDGFGMGSIQKTWQVGETADIVADLYDPTDSAIGTVEVIADGGTVAARQEVSRNCDVIRFSLPAQYRYYYLRITQPDGDVAVTAPVWLESTENLGISGLTCETQVPVQYEAVSLTLTAYNRENTDFLVESLEILADGIPVKVDTALESIPAGEEIAHGITFSYDGIGQTEIRVVLSGTLDGIAREYETSLPLSFRQSAQVTDILVDGSHGNGGLSELGTFRAMAGAEDIRVTVISDGIGMEDLADCRFLLVTAPAQPFSSDFLTAAEEYVRSGGSVLVCGQAASRDGETASAGELNRLLEAIGSTLRLNGDTLRNATYNGGEETLLLPEDIHTADPWCRGVASGQLYRHDGGCSVAPGAGIVLVTSRPTTQPQGAVLCRENTAAGGVVFAAGSLFLGDTELQEPANIWAQPYANRAIARNLLGIGGEALPLSTIRQAREAEVGTVLRVRGYVTAGTANSWNSFPNTLYVQDDTGGIALIPFDTEGIALGTPVEVTGAAGIQDGNRVLKPISCKTLNTAYYRYLPQSGDWKTLLDPDLHGGELVEVEGECTEVILADDGYVSEILLKDTAGNTARVRIEDYIFSGATGENDLHEDIKKGRKIRAMGILHVDESGEPVIRVRNCEEVVYVPPRKIYINPKTGDWLAYFIK